MDTDMLVGVGRGHNHTQVSFILFTLEIFVIGHSSLFVSTLLFHMYISTLLGPPPQSGR